MVESGPDPAIHGVVRWRLIDLAQWIYEEFRITVAKQTLSRELRAMVTASSRHDPRHHAQAEGAIEDFKKPFPARLDKAYSEKVTDVGKIEIWFQDEARIGQMNKITRRWAKRGTRWPRARLGISANRIDLYLRCHLPETARAYLILPFCNTEAMNLHLAEIAKAVAPGAHAVLLVDRAGWHLSARLLIPANITILALPSKCPDQSG